MLLSLSLFALGDVAEEEKRYYCRSTSPPAVMWLRLGRCWITHAQDAFCSEMSAPPCAGHSPLKSIEVLRNPNGRNRKTLRNAAKVSASLNSISAEDFSETNNCGVLVGTESCTISVTFHLLARNNRQAGLAISSSKPASPSAITSSATGIVISLLGKHYPSAISLWACQCAPERHAEECRKDGVEL